MRLVCACLVITPVNAVGHCDTARVERAAQDGLSVHHWDMRLLVILLATVAILGIGTTATAAAPPASTDYAVLAETAASLAHDDPAPADWTIPADNSSANRREAFTDERGRTGWFGIPWFDVDGNSCGTRDDILARDLTDVTYKSGSTCIVDSGILDDPYSGKTITFKRGKGSSQAVQIDHVIPLGFVYAHGGWAWNADKRLQIANDPLNLLAVNGTANAAKSDSGPATSPSGSGTSYTVDGGSGWMPDSAYKCAYAARFTQVAAKYDLGLGATDSQTLTSTLNDCIKNGNGRSAAVQEVGFSWDPTLSDLPRPVLTAARRIGAWATDHPIYATGIGLGVYLVLTSTKRRR